MSVSDAGEYFAVTVHPDSAVVSIAVFRSDPAVRQLRLQAGRLRNDRRHPVSQSGNMAKALQDAGVEHQLVILENGRRAEIQRYYAEMDEFLATNLQ